MISFSSDNEFFKAKTKTFPLMQFFLELTQHIPPKGKMAGPALRGAAGSRGVEKATTAA